MKKYECPECGKSDAITTAILVDPNSTFNHSVLLNSREYLFTCGRCRWDWEDVGLGNTVADDDTDHNTLMAIRDRLSAHDVDAGAARDVIDILLRAGFNLIDPTTHDLYPAPSE